MKELIITGGTNIKHNILSMKEDVIQELVKYDFVVTEDTVIEAKRTMAKLNKIKVSINEKCKEYLIEIEKPIKDLKLDIKDALLLIDNGRFKISSQVSKFEDIKKDKIREIIENEKVFICSQNNIDHNLISIEGLVGLSAVTTSKNGEVYNVTTKVKKDIEFKIITLKNERLVQENIKKEKYLRDEKIRLETIENERERVRINDIAKAKIIPSPVALAKVEDIIAEKVVDGKKVFKILVEFSVKAPHSTPIQKIQGVVSKKLTTLGLEDFIIKD